MCTLDQEDESTNTVAYGELTGENDQEFTTSEDGMYTVQVDIDGCVSSMSDEFEVTIVPDFINENELDKWTVYPVPTLDHITINNIPQSITQCMIVDMQGKQLLSQRIANTSISQLVDLSELRSGTYVLILQGDTVTSSRILQKL